jgi:hypothetical protein
LCACDPAFQKAFQRLVPARESQGKYLHKKKQHFTQKSNISKCNLKEENSKN